MSFPNPGAGITYPRPCSMICAIKIIITITACSMQAGAFAIAVPAHIAPASTIEFIPESTYQLLGDQRDHEPSTVSEALPCTPAPHNAAVATSTTTTTTTTITTACSTQAGAFANETTTKFEMPDTPNGVADVYPPDGLVSCPRHDLFSWLLCLPTTQPPSFADNPQLDPRPTTDAYASSRPRLGGRPEMAHFPAKCAVTPVIPFIADHAAARRIACLATPPSRDAPPTPNMYHPS